MAVKKTATRKPATRRPSAAAQHAQFQRQNDLRALQEADSIRSDSTRMRGAKREALEQRRALDRIAKK